MVFSPAFPSVIQPVFDRGGRPYASLLTNLVSWWTLNETSGDRADSHGSNTLTPINAPGYGTGKKGNALDLENTAKTGYGELLEIADNASLSITGALTLSAWINAESLPSSNGGILSKYVGTVGGTAQNYRSYIIFLNSGGKTSGGVSSAGTFASAALVTGSTTLSTATWYHVALVYVPSTSITVYVNGSSDGANTTSIPASIHDNVSKFWIGRQYADVNTGPTMDYSFDGLIDEAAIWSRALNTSEIGYLYNSGNGITYTDI